MFGEIKPQLLFPLFSFISFRSEKFSNSFRKFFFCFETKMRKILIIFVLAGFSEYRQFLVEAFSSSNTSECKYN